MVWCNPPYSGMSAWVDRFVAHDRIALMALRKESGMTTRDDLAREAERQRWADRMDLQVTAWREGPHPETPDTRIMVSVLMEWANRLRFNEPDGNDVPPGWNKR